jgi:hypothetical protein
MLTSAPASGSAEGLNFLSMRLMSSSLFGWPMQCAGSHRARPTNIRLSLNIASPAPTCDLGWLSGGPSLAARGRWQIHLLSYKDKDD